MLNDNEYDLICIGNYTRDTIISPAGTRYVDGGAINYAAHAAHQLGAKVAVVTRLAIEDKRVVEKFINTGIDCYVTYTPASTTMRLEYPTEDPDFRYLSVTSIAGTITSHEVNGLKARSAVIGTSLRGEVDRDVIMMLHNKKVFLGADMQGFVRVLRDQKLTNEPWKDMQDTLPYFDVVKSDAVEAEFLTGESDIHNAAQVFAQMGPREIVLTHKDGVLALAEGQFYEQEFHSHNLIGRSGRGDTCIGAYMAMRNISNPQVASVWAAAVTSLKMEKLGPFDRSIEEVKALIQAKYSTALSCQ